MPGHLPDPKKKQDPNPLFRVAADFCSRKRDTLFYYWALPITVGLHYKFLGTQDLFDHVAYLSATREGIRAAEMRKATEAAPNLTYICASTTSVFGILAGLMAYNLATHCMIGDYDNARKDAGLAFMMGFLAWRDLRSSNLSMKTHAKLYKDVLFDYFDKIGPKPPKGGKRDRIRGLIDRLKGKTPIPQPI